MLFLLLITIAVSPALGASVIQEYEARVKTVFELHDEFIVSLASSGNNTPSLYLEKQYVRSLDIARNSSFERSFQSRYNATDQWLLEAWLSREKDGFVWTSIFFMGYGSYELDNFFKKVRENFVAAVELKILYHSIRGEDTKVQEARRFMENALPTLATVKREAADQLRLFSRSRVEEVVTTLVRAKGCDLASADDVTAELQLRFPDHSWLVIRYTDGRSESVCNRLGITFTVDLSYVCSSNVEFLVASGNPSRQVDTQLAEQFVRNASSYHVRDMYYCGKASSDVLRQMDYDCQSGVFTFVGVFPSSAFASYSVVGATAWSAYVKTTSLSACRLNGYQALFFT